MARIKIQIPSKQPIYSTNIPVRVTDINYGNHVGNDTLLSIVQEARVQMLIQLGFSELDIGGCGMIMADAGVMYKNEGLYGDVFNIEMYIDDISSVSFDIIYKITTVRDGNTLLIAIVKTGMVCFEYSQRQICEMPKAFSEVIGYAG